MNNKIYILFYFSGLLLALMPFITYLKLDRHDTHCVFCEIIINTTTSIDNNNKIEVETDEFVIFKDIKPESTHHYLAVSKRHIANVKKLDKADAMLVTHMETGLKEFFINKGVDINDALFGFHLPPFTSVQHLHMHAISPKSAMNFIKRFMFMPGTLWFKSAEEARHYIEEKC